MIHNDKDINLILLRQETHFVKTENVIVDTLPTFSNLHS